MGFFYLEKCKLCKRLYIIRRKSHQYVAQIVAICLGTRCPPHGQSLPVSCSPVPHHVVPEGSLEEHGWYCSFLYLVDYIDCSKAIQVSYSIQDDKTYERETKALIVYAKRFDCKELFIITMDEEEEININDNIIHVMPLWKMLLKGI